METKIFGTDSVGRQSTQVFVKSLHSICFLFSAEGFQFFAKHRLFLAGISFAMLYLTVLTLFLSMLVWDTQRVEKRKADCCRLFCCREDSILFARGHFLSKKQKEFSGLIPPVNSSKPSHEKSKTITVTTRPSTAKLMTSSNPSNDRHSSYADEASR